MLGRVVTVDDGTFCGTSRPLVVPHSVAPVKTSLVWDWPACRGCPRERKDLIHVKIVQQVRSAV